MTSDSRRRTQEHHQIGKSRCERNRNCLTDSRFRKMGRERCHDGATTTSQSNYSVAGSAITADQKKADYRRPRTQDRGVQSVVLQDATRRLIQVQRSFPTARGSSAATETLSSQ